jgi:hypothetical protein
MHIPRGGRTYMNLVRLDLVAHGGSLRLRHDCVTSMQSVHNLQHAPESQTAVGRGRSDDYDAMGGKRKRCNTARARDRVSRDINRAGQNKTLEPVSRHVKKTRAGSQNRAESKQQASRESPSIII